MRKKMLSGALSVLVLAFAGTAQAGTFDPSQSTLSVILGALPPITIVGSGGSASFDGTTLTDSAGIWATMGSVGTTLFTGVPLISNIVYTVGNAAGTVSTAGVAYNNPNGAFVGGALQGSEGLTGQTVIMALGGAVSIPVPLSNVGVGGNFATNTLGVVIQVHAAGFGTQATITNVTTTTPNGVTNTGASSTFSGGVSTTVGGDQIVTLVSPLRVDTGGLAGNLAAFAVKSFRFVAAVPEPGTLLLLGSGVAGLVVLGGRRRKQ